MADARRRLADRADAPRAIPREGDAGRQADDELDRARRATRAAREAVRARPLRNRAFLDDLEPFVARIKAAGEHASLGALLLQLTAPGVPDIYQGDELWSLNLVDPDNRRPVDWRRASRSRSGRRGPRR